MTLENLTDLKPSSRKMPLNRFQLLKSLAVGLGFILLSVFILEFEWISADDIELEVGDVSFRDIVAPSFISYESEIATSNARDDAEALVADIYSRPDPAVARQQRALASQVIAFIDAIRVDPYATQAQKIAWIQEIEPISLSTEEAENILRLGDGLWLDAKQEILSVLDEAMGTEIRESQLSIVRRRLPVMISSSAPDAESDTVIAIAEDLIRPNTFVDETRTSEARQLSRDAVQAIVKTFEANEIVVREGEVISGEDIEALQTLGIQRPANRSQSIITTAIWLTTLISLFAYYLVKYHPNVLRDNEKLALLASIMLVFVVAIRAMTPDQTYAIPMAALTIVVATTLEPRLAIITTLIMAFILVYVAGGGLELMAYIILTSLVVALAVGKMMQLHHLLWAGLAAVLSNIVIVLVFFLAGSSGELTLLATKVGSALLSGVLSVGLALVALLIIGKVTGMTTYIQLLELSRPTHPLLSELLRRAPGTYHHSLLVSNLAEHAAERIGADAFLCRIGAYYHDVGKMLRPYFFTENTVPGMKNLHEDLDPETSAQILISHVTDGLELAKKYRLPKILLSFIAEHHGTEVPGYFYHKAVENAAGDATKVDKSRFTYPGPSPQTRETAIMMLADASEATVRSVQPQSMEEIDKIVRNTIAKRIESGQFDECDLSLRDLEQIRIAFTEVLKGVSHPRVKYPDQVKEANQLKTGPLPLLPLAVQSSTISNQQSEGDGDVSRAIPRD